MNIGDNKKVLAFGAVFALAFAGVMYLGYQSSSDASAMNEKLIEIESSFESLNSAEYPPTAASEKILKAATKKVSALKNNLEDELQNYAKAASVKLKISPVEFQTTLQKNIAELAALAKKKGTILGVPAATLGMGNFQNSAAVQSEVPYRDFQLRAINHAVDLLIESGAPIINKVYCAQLPAEAEADIKDAPDFFPMIFELSFKAKRGTLPAFFNALLSDKDFFYTVTGISAASSERVGDLDKYVAPATDVVVAGDEGEEAAAPAARVLAVKKFGKSDELVDVHMTMQVLFFNPTANIK